MSDLQRVRVMHIMAGNEEGGLEKHVEELVNLLAARVSVLLVAHPKYADRVAPGVEFVPLDLTRNRNNPVTLVQLARILHKYQPDIVHAQAGKAAAIVAKLRKLSPAKLVATVHGQKRKQNYLRHFDLVIGVSHAVAEDIPNEHRQVVYNGVNLDRLKERLPNSAPADPRCEVPKFLAVGRLVPVKGFHTLLEAWKQVDALLDIIGDGPEEEALAAQIADDPWLTQRVSLLGYRADVPNRIQAADCVIISSQREGFSYVFAEAMLLGTPVLATDVPIANEVLSREFLCERDSAEALASLINHHRGHADFPASLTTQQAPYFSWALEQLTIESMVDRTLTCYASLVDDAEN